MKTLKYKSLVLLACVVAFFTACDDVERVEIDPEGNVIVSLSETSVVLDEDLVESAVLTISWTEPDFGFNSAPSYRILMDVAGGDFSNPQVVPAGIETQKVFKHGELNAKLLSLGMEANAQGAIDIIVETTLSGSFQTLSDVVSLGVTPYSSLLDLSTEWGVVGSATPGGWGSPDIKDLPFYTTNETGVYVAYVTLRTGEIKFRLNNDWTTNYGDDGSDGTLDQNGANIAVSAGTYKITVNTNALSWEMEPYSWGIVGSATPNGWDGPDLMLEYNPFGDNWKGAVTFVDGDTKIRFNDDWGLNYGDDGNDGTLEQNGANIPVEAGHYLVTLDLNTLEYAAEQADLWGLVGSATANGWDGPNQKFIPDFGINEGYYYIHGAVLTSGEIKIRQNDAWGVNYGDDGNDGTLELNGANIPVTAGTYNIILNFSVDPPTIQLFPWQ